jgi:hypothetical protein
MYREGGHQCGACDVPSKVKPSNTERSAQRAMFAKSRGNEVKRFCSPEAATN